MRSLPAWWLNLHPDECKSPGMWDQTMLLDTLEKRLWVPPGMPDFVDPESPRYWGDRPGVVLVPGRFHTSVEDLASINRWLATLTPDVMRTIVVIVTSDEESLFPWRGVRWADRLWIMTPRTDNHMTLGNRYIGEGYSPGTREEMPFPMPLRDIDVSFSGQVTHPHRAACVSAARALPDSMNVWLYATQGFTQGLPHAEYVRTLARSKVVLCPSGPATPDSFRFFETLEAGAVPIVEDTAPGSKGAPGYWDLLFHDFKPLPVHVMRNGWDPAELRKKVRATLMSWPAGANKVSAWYQNYKREQSYRLMDDLGLSAIESQYETLHDCCTVVITTSPIRSHPSTKIIEKVIASVRAQDPLVEIVIAIDGVRPEQEAYRERYERYVNRLMQLCNNRYQNVLPVLCEEWGHQANAMRKALEYVRTPLVMFVEHDMAFETAEDLKIDWSVLLKAFDNKHVDLIRFLHESEILPEYWWMMLSDHSLGVSGVKITPTAQWSQRPHIARTETYRRLIETYFGKESRTMIEDVMHGVLMEAWRNEGAKGWERFKTWIYTPDGNMRRAYHLDGRQDDPKFDMVYEYDGPTPEFAPRAMSERVD